ncbi:MAG: CHAD domain-containing protein [Chloroflexota bacterium]
MKDKKHAAGLPEDGAPVVDDAPLLAAAQQLFDSSQELHALEDDGRAVLQTAALLVGRRLPKGKKKPAEALLELVKQHNPLELNADERAAAAAVLALYHGLVKRKQLDRFSLAPLQQRQSLTLAALLRLAGAIEQSGLALERVQSRDGSLWLVTGGPEPGEAAVRAVQRAARLWEKVGYPPVEVLESEQARLRSLPFPEVQPRPGLDADEPLAEAARKVMRFHFARMLAYEDGARLGEDIEALHDMRVATRRLRAAFDVFADAFEPGVLKPYLKGLRQAGRALGKVRDLDVFMEKAQHYLADLPAGAGGGEAFLPLPGYAAEALPLELEAAMLAARGSSGAAPEEDGLAPAAGDDGAGAARPGAEPGGVAGVVLTAADLPGAGLPALPTAPLPLELEAAARQAAARAALELRAAQDDLLPSAALPLELEAARLAADASADGGSAGEAPPLEVEAARLAVVARLSGAAAGAHLPAGVEDAGADGAADGPGEPGRPMPAAAVEPPASPLEPLFEHWHLQRQAARDELLAFLDSPAYAAFKRDFNMFVHSPGAGARWPTPETFGTVEIPPPSRVRELAPQLIYTRLAEARAFGPHLDGAPVDLLHALRIEFKKLRYTVEYFQEALGRPAKDVINDLKALQDHLGDLNDAQVAAGMLGQFIAGWDAQQAQLPASARRSSLGVAAYLAYRQAEMQRLRVTFRQAWEAHFGAAFVQNLGQAVAEL